MTKITGTAVSSKNLLKIDISVMLSLFYHLVLLSNQLTCDRRSLPTNRPLKLVDLIFTSPQEFQESIGSVMLAK